MSASKIIKLHLYVYFLLLNFLLFFFASQIVIAGFAYAFGNPLKIINGYDSFGNTCGVSTNRREKELSETVSGISTIDKPYVFFFDFKEIKQSLKICVKNCPTREIESARELYNIYQYNQTGYCRYDFDFNKLNSASDRDEMIFDLIGPCPKLPIHATSPLLNRCIPNGKNSPLKEANELYNVISRWDFVEQTASDLYKSWHIILIVCFVSLVFSIILIGLLHYLTQLISWLIAIFVAISSIAITVLLWWTYYDLKKKKESGELSSVAQYVQNETAVYIFAIIATM
jgi:solute carrier family 44 (choline transporter-like protein), member 1